MIESGNDKDKMLICSLQASDWIVKSTVTKEDLKAWAQSLDST